MHNVLLRLSIACRDAHVTLTKISALSLVNTNSRTHTCPGKSTRNMTVRSMVNWTTDAGRNGSSRSRRCERFASELVELTINNSCSDAVPTAVDGEHAATNKL